MFCKKLLTSMSVVWFNFISPEINVDPDQPASPDLDLHYFEIRVLNFGKKKCTQYVFRLNMVDTAITVFMLFIGTP